MNPGRQSGLRLQIVLALGGLMLLAFVPLFFAVASLARATVWSAGEASARRLAAAVAAHAKDARASGGRDAVARVIEDQVRVLGKDGVVAACVSVRSGDPASCAGDTEESEVLQSHHGAGSAAPPSIERPGSVVEVTAPVDSGWLGMRIRLDDTTTRATPLLRLVALYMTTFALALVVFAYFSLTRLIVRPIDELVRAADKVARGARSLRVPRKGPAELAELATTMQAMAGRLIAEEASLQLKVEELTETTTRLTEAQANLVQSERLASVGRLAAGLAHEIGNPIAALMGMQDLLLDGDLPPETQRDFLQRMRREAERIHGVLRDLLDFARPEKAEAGEAPAGGTSVGATLEDVVALVRPQKAFRAVRVATDVDGSPAVLLPAAQLTQVLLNVILNAGAAIAAGGRQDGVVVARARRIGDRVRVEVEDDGPGIAPEVKGHLFEPFVTTKPTGEGTGLGLAVCRGLVEGAGGTISVDDTYGPGARFVIELPAATDEFD